MAEETRNGPHASNEPGHTPAERATEGSDGRSDEHTGEGQKGHSPASVDWQKPETWPREVGGNGGPEPTRYGDWESNGRCTDF
jgi:hypothetical protein